MSLFKRWNNLTGWLVFAIAAFVYLKTMEPVSSLWDCSEFIATSYKLEVGHPPGAPLFMLLARLATLFAFGNPEYVGIAVNAMNALASACCILFLFWTITHLGRRLLVRSGAEPTAAERWAILGAGAVGALAYTFTDTFWFSAAEGEVYALSSMFTALVVWLMLKWEEHADEPGALRWIVLIAYLMGLSIGVHILNLLTIPALALIYYFRRTERTTLKGVTLALLAGCAALLFINNLIIPYTVWAGAMVDLLFVNGFGLPVNSGMVCFSLALIGGMGWATWRAHCKGRVVLNTILLCITMILVGFSSYASVTIRASVNPPMNSNNPNNPHALLSFLNRDQYGQRPLFTGAYYSAPKRMDAYQYKSIYYLNDEGRYSPATLLNGYHYDPQFIHLFPRMWDSRKSEQTYRQWAAYRTKIETLRDENGEILRDEQGRPQRGVVPDFGRRRTYTDEYGESRSVVEPTFLENLNFFFNYQLSYMYWRYFLWNFVGRQSDIQPSGSTITDGNWLSGIRWIDEKYTGPQTGLPREVEQNAGRNTYYFLPFLLGLIGLIYQLNRDQRNFSIVMIFFLMTGIALVFYFNTSPGEPRERDYVYAGSFYAYCIWIGLGVLALRELLVKLTRRDTVAHAAVATVVALSVPAILCAENWDDHDRSHRYMARDIGWNFLQSTLPNSIILNYGDNDTFPLWNNQEVYGVRPDVRIMNTSYLGAEWYIDEMKTRANEAAGVPFSLPRRKYTNTNEMVPVTDRTDRVLTLKEAIDFVRSDDPRSQLRLENGTPEGETVDFIPSHRLALPVNKENAIASGIVKESDRDLMVDTVYFKLDKNYLDRSQLMLLDMLANFDWKRPIYLTQPYMFLDLGLGDYLQYDGYAYRFVPIFTSIKETGSIGRIDPDYAAPRMRDLYRYGNLADPRVHVDHFMQYNLNASRVREGFARVARELLRQNRVDEAVELVDLGLERLPTSKILFTFSNTFPYLEIYYTAGAAGHAGAYEKGDALAREYVRTLCEYIDYYDRFSGAQANLVANELEDRLSALNDVYYLAYYAGRTEILREINDYFRSLGVAESDLLDAGDRPAPLDQDSLLR